jgi:hypothetical protein
MNFAEGMNILAKNTNLKKQKEAYERAQSIFENFKPSIKHFANLGYYQTTFTMSPSETCKEDREDILIALKNIFRNEGFDIQSCNYRKFSFVVSWAHAITDEAVV